MSEIVTTTYTSEFIAQVKEYAVLGLYPIQIAERMGLSGSERTRFLFDINSKHHPLRSAYLIARSHWEEDMDAALTTLATAGDVDALELASKVEWRKGIESIKSELFDL
ncbi:MAG: hypothetical protein J6J25_04440 [Bacteroidales bacterium]|nr:hypothetical protein [Bacteroidales bacterium]